jgi:hypothetical protein
MRLASSTSASIVRAGPHLLRGLDAATAMHGAFEEVVTYVLMIEIGSSAVVTALIRGDRFGGGTTICLVVIALGAIGLVQLAARRAGLPRARARPARTAASRRSLGRGRSETDVRARQPWNARTRRRARARSQRGRRAQAWSCLATSCCTGCARVARLERPAIEMARQRPSLADAVARASRDAAVELTFGAFA